MFLEGDWEDAIDARHCRAARIEELQTQGFLCSAENLWTVQGDPVYLLVASRNAPDVQQASPRRERSQHQDDPARRPMRRSSSTPSVEVH